MIAFAIFFGAGAIIVGYALLRISEDWVKFAVIGTLGIGWLPIYLCATDPAVQIRWEGGGLVEKWAFLSMLEYVAVSGVLVLLGFMRPDPDGVPPGIKFLSLFYAFPEPKPAQRASNTWSEDAHRIVDGVMVSAQAAWWSKVAALFSSQGEEPAGSQERMNTDDTSPNYPPPAVRERYEVTEVRNDPSQASSKLAGTGLSERVKSYAYRKVVEARTHEAEAETALIDARTNRFKASRQHHEARMESAAWDEKRERDRIEAEQELSKLSAQEALADKQRAMELKAIEHEKHKETLENPPAPTPKKPKDSGFATEVEDILQFGVTGKNTAAAERSIANFIKEKGGEENLTEDDKNNIATVRAMAAAKDRGRS